MIRRKAGVLNLRLQNTLFTLGQLLRVKHCFCNPKSLTCSFLPRIADLSPNNTFLSSSFFFYVAVHFVVVGLSHTINGQGNIPYVRIKIETHFSLLL